MANDRRQSTKESKREIKERLLRKREIDEDKRDIDFEKHDVFAMVLALSYYLVPIFIVVVLVFWFMIRLIFF